MILPDVNVLIYAHREDTEDHEAYREWLRSTVNSDQAYAMSDIVLSAVIRIVTNPRVFKVPTTLDKSFEFANELLQPDQCRMVQPGPRHWQIFSRLCRESGAKGGIVTDAFLAALAIEAGCEWITTDRDFSRFGGLRWRHPLR